MNDKWILIANLLPIFLFVYLTMLFYECLSFHLHIRTDMKS